MVDDAPDDYFAIRRARRRKRLRIAARVGAALAAIAFVAWGPGWMIERAAKSYEACSNADFADKPDPTTDCTRAKLWLLFPKIVPWKRGQALERSRKIDRDAADRTLTLVTSFRPDPKARDEAVGAVLRNFDEGRTKPDELAASLATNGVGWAIGERRKKLDTSFAQNGYFRQLLAHGDVDEAIAFAKDAPKIAVEDYAARDTYLVRGALACLSGDETLGRRLLHDAMRVHAQHHDFPYTEARIGLAACGEVVEPRHDDLDRIALLTFQVGSAIHGRDLEDRLVGTDDSRIIRHEHTSPFVAAALAERERSLEDTLEIAAALDDAPKEGLTFWAWENAMPAQPALVEPSVHEKAAERLEALSKSAPESQPKLDDDARFHLPIYTADRYLAYHQAPKRTFERIARALWIESAGAWSLEHQCDRAEAATRRAHALGEGGSERLYMTSLLVACDRWDAAAELARNEADTTRLGAALLAGVRAQALAHSGKFAEAREAAKQAYERVGNVDVTAQPLAELSDAAFLRASMGYLFLALSLRARDPSGAPALATPTIYERDKSTWDAFAAKPEAERAEMRWRMFDYQGPLYSAARPAELFVVGSVAPDAGVEVWLDRAAFPWAGGKAGLLNMRARAEAARWRGDAVAEKEWLRRAGNVIKVTSDARKAILARLAGL